MDEESVIQYITRSLAGVDVFDSSGNRFFFFDFDPGGNVEPDRRLPFATLVTSDEYDSASDLDRPGIYRLNIGVGRDTYRRLFGPGVPRAGADGIVDTGHDFTSLDQIMPHPIYAPQFWVCVLSPSATTFEAVKPLLAEAHQRSANRHARTHKADLRSPPTRGRSRHSSPATLVLNSLSRSRSLARAVTRRLTCRR